MALSQKEIKRIEVMELLPRAAEGLSFTPQNNPPAPLAEGPKSAPCLPCLPCEKCPAPSFLFLLTAATVFDSFILIFSSSSR